MTSIVWGLRLPLRFLLLLLCFSGSSMFVMKDPVTGLVACRPHQIQTVMDFKREFDSSSCNQTDYFKGVWCNNTTGEVAKLKVPSGCLSGTLKPNSSLFHFHHLRYLALTQNHFTSSSLPSGFGNLNKLEVLSLSSNGFVGQVPSSFSNLTMLSFLDLSENKLTGSFPLIQNLTKLSVLDLSDNNFFGTIPSSLFTMPFLSFLDLAKNKLTGPIEIIHNSSSSTGLNRLALGGNNFNAQILEPISKLITLEHLDLSFLNTSYSIDLSYFSSLKSLLYLDLSGNSISPANLSQDSGIPLSIENLFISSCSLSEFPNILKPLQNLTLIAISNNRIKGKVPSWFWSLPRLISVDLLNNSLSGFQGPAEVLANSSVEVLDLSFNSFEGVFPTPPLPIASLFARNNNFTGNIPLSVCNRNALKLLDLSYNSFTGPIPRCLSKLTLLNLRKNNLEGTLPDMFDAGASLEAFDVGYNQLTGKLPRSLLNCTSLRYLTADHNRISDSFPFWLKALPNLQVLILCSNTLYGPISPPDHGPLAFPELRIFQISDNNFTGSLTPSYFLNWKATSVQMNEDGSIYMGYNNNNSSYGVDSYSYEDTIDLQYKGLFVEQSKVFTSYSTIDFSGNKLEGQIPESIGLLKTLIALNLSYNAFTGHIPLSLANVSELQSLDLSRNQLSGTIPSGLKTLSFLAYISVAHNQLKGEIPQGTQITGQAKSSFEGNAWLCGLPLVESCFGTHSPPAQQPKEEANDEEEQVLNWKAGAIGYAVGVLFGLAIAQLIASYQPEWLAKI